ncbi:MAG: SIS domain-containing protein [Candidatus Omnitrophica bacterium]|nr:SIS domain-containing protein [Candidatus Omnitrophota bacterium]
MKKAKKSQIEKIAYEHTRLLRILSSKKFQRKIGIAVSIMFAAIKDNKKIIVCGNGGSAADSQHLAGELVGRFQKERKALPCIALTTNTSIITAIGNDYSFEKVFSRQIEAIGNNGDVLILFSTSGRSKNILDAALTAKKKNIKAISLTGSEPNELANISDINIAVPSKSTPRIQELHSIVIHIICGLLEEKIFPDAIRKD